MPNIILPPKAKGSSNVEFHNPHSLVILGANGSGKSRLGAKIEKLMGDSCHRISAQRALNIPELINPQPLDSAQKKLMYGHYSNQWSLEIYRNQKENNRWGGNPSTHMLNDFEVLLALLFANEGKRNREYAQAAKDATPSGPPPLSYLDRIQEIWNIVLPHRKLIVGDDKIMATAQEGFQYAGSEMSDGERVVIYLIGQVLCAPTDSVVIVDEPEIHIHKAIQARLWDEIELARPDCAFIYVTHDLDFAATRTSARKIWIKKYDGTNWEWDEIPDGSEIPEPLLFQLLGSRRPVLIVEGDPTSHDAAIYSALYPKELVISHRGCETVIQSTKSMIALKASGLHHLHVRGIVDRDRRNEEEITALRANGLLIADVAEVENLMCLPEAIQAVATQLSIPDVPTACAKAQKCVLDHFASDLEQESRGRVLKEIQFRLNGFGPKVGKLTSATLAAEMQAYVSTIDVATSVASIAAILTKVIEDQDYIAALRLYNSKGIPAFVASALGIDKRIYTQMIFGILREDPSGTVASAMRAAIG